MPPWLMIVNLDGRRFMDETQGYMITSHLLKQQPSQFAYALLDQDSLEKTSQHSSFDPYDTGTVATWSSDMLHDRIADGTIISAGSIAAWRRGRHALMKLQTIGPR